MNSLKHAALGLALALAAAPLSAQIQHPPRRTVATLGTCAASGVSGPRLVIATDGTSTTDCATGGGATRALCMCDGASWAAVGAGGSGDITAVGDCATGACFQAVGATQFLAGPGGGGVAAFRAIADADVPDTITVSLAATATALAANGANCPAGQWAAGVDASGAAEGCTADAGGGTPSEIADADADTGCEVERTADSDILACRTGGIDRFTVGTNGQTSIQATTFPQLIVAGGAPGSGSADSGQVRVGKGGSGQYLSVTYTMETLIAKVTPENNSASLILGSGNVLTLTLRNDGNAVFLKGVRLTPQASPPWACSVAGDNGREYIDDSGARCTCWAGAWIMTDDLSGSGSCA